jgi:hypothetical protein
MTASSLPPQPSALQRSASAFVLPSNDRSDGPRITPMGPGAFSRHTSPPIIPSSHGHAHNTPTLSSSTSPIPSSYYAGAQPSPLFTATSPLTTTSPLLSSSLISSSSPPSFTDSPLLPSQTSTSIAPLSSTPTGPSTPLKQQRGSRAQVSSNGSVTPNGRRTTGRTISAGIASFFRLGGKEKTVTSAGTATTSSIGGESTSSIAASATTTTTVAIDSKLAPASLRRGESQPLTDTSSSTSTTQPSSATPSVASPTLTSQPSMSHGGHGHGSGGSTSSSRVNMTYKRAIWNENKHLAQPVYDLIDELFSISSRGWVRRQTTWIGKQIIQLLFNSDINTMISAKVEWALSEPRLVAMVDWISNIVWPGTHSSP